MIESDSSTELYFLSKIPPQSMSKNQIRQIPEIQGKISGRSTKIFKMIYKIRKEKFCLEQNHFEMVDWSDISNLQANFHLEMVETISFLIRKTQLGDHLGTTTWGEKISLAPQNKLYLSEPGIQNFHFQPALYLQILQ